MSAPVKQRSKNVEAINVAVVAGRLSSEPVTRELPSGSTVLQLEITVPGHDGPAETAPVAWFDPPPSAAGLVAGDEVVAVGRVRRRFFRAGGVTQSRTEVVASEVVATRRRAQVSRLLATAAEEVTGGA